MGVVPKEALKAAMKLEGVARLLFLTLLPAMPDTQHRDGVIVGQVTRVLVSSDPVGALGGHATSD